MHGSDILLGTFLSGEASGCVMLVPTAQILILFNVKSCLFSL